MDIAQNVIIKMEKLKKTEHNNIVGAAKFLEWYEKNVVELNPPPELKKKLTGLLECYGQSLEKPDITKF